MAAVLRAAPMAHGMFAREDTEPLLPGQMTQPLIPEGPRLPLAMMQANLQGTTTPRQGASLALPVKKREVMPARAPEAPQVSQHVLWERPPKPAGWSAIWEVLPPPPPPPLDQDGVWIWVPEGEEIPVGAIVPHEAMLPHADVDDEMLDSQGSPKFGVEKPLRDLELTTGAGFSGPSTVEVAVAPSLPPGPAEVWQPFPSEAHVSSASTAKDSGSGPGVAQVWQPFPSQVSGPVGEPSSQAWQPFPSQMSCPAAEPCSQQAWQPFPSQLSSPPEPSQQAWQPYPSQISAPATQTQPVSQAQAFPSQKLAGPGAEVVSSTAGSVRGGPQLPPTATQQTPREQAWQPFPSQLSGPVAEPSQQAWNPWATSLGANEAAFWGNASGTDPYRRIVGDIGAFDSGDIRPTVLGSRQSLPPSSAVSARSASSSSDAKLPTTFEDMNALEGTAFWQVPQMPSGHAQSGALISHLQPQQRNQVRSSQGAFGSVPGLGSGVLPMSRPSAPSAGSGGTHAQLTSTSEGLEVTYAVAQPVVQGHPSMPSMHNGHFMPGAAATNQQPWMGSCAAAWPMPNNLPGPHGGGARGVQLLDITGLYHDAARPSSHEVLGPMRPNDGQNSRVQTWMNDPRLARQPVAQVAERNRHAAPVLLDIDVTGRGDRTFAPDD